MQSLNSEVSQVSQTWLEHQALEHIKRALRVTIEWLAPAVSYRRKLQSVIFAFHSFNRHLERLMKIEEQDGYMRMVVDAKPSKSKLVSKLRDDHSRFRARVSKLSEQLDLLEDWQESEFERICTDIDRLLKEIDRHDHAEVQLLQDALIMDEGVGD